MLNFRQIELNDKNMVKSYLEYADLDTLEYSFTTMIIWQINSKTLIAEEDGLLYVQVCFSNKSLFLMPQGREFTKEDVDKIFEYGKANEISIGFYGLTEHYKALLENWYEEKLAFKKDHGDYIYEAEKLITLSGKKLNSKRNHINRFLKENPNWHYEPITKENIDEAYQMNLEWKKQMECYETDSLKSESCAVNAAFKHFFDLGLSGAMLKIGGRVIAYTMGESLNSDTYIVHIEKAFGEINGAYAMINKEFASKNCENFAFINREDDAGDEGLEKAKLSYRPYKIAVKYTAKEI